MKKTTLVMSVLIVFLGTFSVAGENTWLGVRTSLLRDKPSFLGKSLAKLEYQQKLDLLNKGDDWSKVRLDDKTGWVHNSALSDKLAAKVVKKKKSVNNGFNFGGEDFSNTDDSEEEDITLAGKGFNRDVENAYSQEQENLNYDAVNLMEQWEITGFSATAFAAEGGLEYLAPDQWSIEAEKPKSDFSNPLGIF